MKNTYRALLLAYMLVFTMQGIAQKELTVGDQCPDFALNNIINYSKTSARVSDFRGRFLLLDFWATWCSPCIASFPNIEALQEKHKTDLQVLPVTFEDKETVISFLQNMQKIKGLKPPVTLVEDSVLNVTFKHAYIPHYVWINKEGIIYAITGFEDVNEQNIEAALAGKPLNLQVKREEKTDINPNIPVFSGKQQIALSDSGLIYHSVLSAYNDRLFSYMSVDSNRITGINLSIEQLFKLALGKLQPAFVTGSKVILDIKDTSTPNNYAFGYSTDEKLFNQWKWQHLVCYELLVPKSMQQDKFMIMQHDLESYFDLSGAMEKRKVKCFVLIRTSKEDKLRSTGGDPAWEHNHFYMHIANQPLKAFLAALVLDMQTQLPLIDETGYEGNVDLQLNANMSDINSINEALKKYDLQFIEAERPTDFIVLRQKRPSN
jgi:thiol-disulfide isomerase/thioredoxin